MVQAAREVGRGRRSAKGHEFGVAPIDYCPDAPAVKAIEQLAELFLPQEVSL